MATLRIISGKYKSRQIKTLPNYRNTSGNKSDSLRPTSDRARVMLFDILANKISFENVRCLDLFAGTGSFGFECISRGAYLCTFVDISAKNLQAINKTAEELDCLDQIETVKDDALNFLNLLNTRYDIIFADPPYNYRHYNELSELMSRKITTAGIIEFSQSGSADNFIKSGFDTQIRKAGKTNFKILTASSI